MWEKEAAECSTPDKNGLWQERVLICFHSNHLICWCNLRRKEIRIYIFLPSLLIPPSPPSPQPPHFTFSHLFCSVLFSVKNSTPAIANSSLLGDALTLGSCLPKDRGIISLKTSYFAILKAESLSLSQKTISQSSLSVLSPYANLMGSCLRSKCDCPLYHSMIVWVHMCSHAGGVCACTRGSRVSMKWFKHQTTGRVC